MRSETILRVSLYAALFLIPFFFVPLSWFSVADAKSLVIALCGGAGAIAFVVARIYRGTLLIPKHPLFFAVALPPIAYLVSALVSGGSWDSFVGTGGAQDTVVAVALWYALFLIAFYTLSTERSRTSIAMTIFVLGSVILVIVQLVHIFLPSLSLGVLTDPTSTIVGGWHDFAIVLGLVFFFTLTWSDTSPRQVALSAIQLRALALVSFLFLIIINQWDVWAVLGIASLVYALYVRRADGLTQRSRVFLMWIAVAIVAFAMSYWGGQLHNRLPTSLQIVQTEVRPSWEGTMAVGQNALQGGGFIFGSGPNTFPQLWGAYKPLSVNSTQFWSTDFYSGVGFIPTSIITTGFLGLIAWGAIVIALLWSLKKVLGARGATSAPRATLAIGALYLTALSILYSPGAAIAGLTFLLFGVLVATDEVGTWTLSLSWAVGKSAAAAASLTVLAIVIGLSAIQYVRAALSDAFATHAVALANEQDLSGAAHAANIALLIFPQNASADRTVVDIGTAQLAQLSAQSGSNAARAALQDTLTRTLNRALDAVAVDPGNYLNWLSLGNLYSQLAQGGVQGADQNARSAFAKARVENPTNPLPLIGLAQLDIAAGDTKSARDHLASASAMKSDIPLTHYLLVQVDAREGDLTAAQNEASTLAQLSPTDPLSWYTFGSILYARGSYGDAGPALLKAISLQPGYANAYFVLGLTYFELGQKDTAIAAFQNAGKLDPSNPLPASVIANIIAGRTPLQGAATSTPTQPKKKL